jgi:hypothetical protein
MGVQSMGESINDQGDLGTGNKKRRTGTGGERLGVGVGGWRLVLLVAACYMMARLSASAPNAGPLPPPCTPVGGPQPVVQPGRHLRENPLCSGKRF